MQDIIIYGPIQFDIGRRRIIVNEQEVYLTKHEFDLLEVLLEKPEKVIHREYLIKRVWGVDYLEQPNNLDQAVSRIRKKLGTHSISIRTVRQVGYSIEGSGEKCYYQKV